MPTHNRVNNISVEKVQVGCWEEVGEIGKVGMRMLWSMNSISISRDRNRVWGMSKIRDMVSNILDRDKDREGMGMDVKMCSLDIRFR
jgi:hypothetical protein